MISEYDHDLVELAADACDLVDFRWVEGRYCWYNTESRKFYKDSFGDNIQWDPLNDDGDAFRLAVELEILTTHYKWFITFFNEEIENSSSIESHKKAIVRAAAKLNKTKEK